MSVKILQFGVSTCTILFNVAILPLLLKGIIGPVYGLVGATRLAVYAGALFFIYKTLKYIFDELSPLLYKYYSDNHLVWFLSVHFDKEIRSSLNHAGCLKGLFGYTILFSGTIAVKLIVTIVGGIVTIRRILNSETSYAVR